ncbi:MULTISPECIES: phosphoserine phosphatase SerB [unclassified Janibacter]|uniref:phosphoserine phosphatase SerB n=1 Tax=unclassified Janibacter TaxID=2649294 RepID=UPI003CFD27C0
MSNDSSPAPAADVTITLVGDSVPDSAVRAVGAVLEGAGLTVAPAEVTSHSPVAAIVVRATASDTSRGIGELRAQVAPVAVEHGIDIAVVPTALCGLSARLVVMDVDSTFIRDEVIELIAEHAGTRDEVAAVTEAAMRGELDFAQSLHARVATLAGLSADVLDDVRDAVRVTPGAATLVRTVKELGGSVALVSGGFEEIVAPLAAGLGVDHVRANRLEIVDGRLTGKVLGAVIDRAAKAVALREFALASGLPLETSLAIGDGANDLDMLDLAGLGVAFNAKPALRARADASLTVGRLDAALHLVGIPRSAFVLAEGD